MQSLLLLKKYFYEPAGDMTAGYTTSFFSCEYNLEHELVLVLTIQLQT
jgi:hypothetical protein